MNYYAAIFKGLKDLNDIDKVIDKLSYDFKKNEEQILKLIEERWEIVQTLRKNLEESKLRWIDIRR